MNVGQLRRTGGRDTITDLFLFYYVLFFPLPPPSSPSDAPPALIAIKTKCPSEAICALCGPYVWVLIERGLLCLGRR